MDALTRHTQTVIAGQTGYAVPLVVSVTGHRDLVDDVIAISTIKRRFAKKLGRCFAGSRPQFDRGRYTNATNKLRDECNKMVLENLDEFTSTLSSPNPSGELVGRTANLFFTIDVRLNNGNGKEPWPIELP